MTDKNKENIATLLKFAMTQSQREQMEQATKELAHFIKTQYDAYRSEGFSKADAEHFCDLTIMGLFNSFH